jgi:hypothetical protein
MTRLLIYSVYVTLYGSFLLYLGSSVVLLYYRLSKVPSPERISTLWRRCKWLGLAFVLLNPVMTVLIDHRTSFIGHVSNVVFPVYWWLFRNMDDDHTKRLKRKLKEKIKRVDSRLVVVPA